jgi:FtsH-binding integral membrane protein
MGFFTGVQNNASAARAIQSPKIGIQAAEFRSGFLAFVNGRHHNGHEYPTMNKSSSTNEYVITADAGTTERGQFIRRTYLHLAGAILAFVAIEAALLNSPVAPALMNLMTGGKYSWLIVLALFMGVSWLAQKWADSGASLSLQYAGLALYVVAQAVIFVPLLSVAVFYSSPDVIPMAAMITGGLFLGLTGVVVTTRADFSFLRSVLMIGGFVAMGVIVASIVFGFNLGLLFSGIMVLFAGAAVLYSTSNVFRSYRTDQYVAASLSLFASIALLFWYILRIVLSFRR